MATRWDYLSQSERFWEKVEWSPGCWEWVAHRNASGYGQFQVGQRTSVLAHRMAWRMAFGDPGKLHVCHHCDNPSCVNPEHLFLGTDSDNQQDAIRKGRFPRRDGEHNGQSKLSLAEVADLRAAVASGMNAAAAGRLFDISKSAAARIVRGKTWRNG